MLTVGVLGPVEVRRDGVPVDLGGPQQRAVVAHLALEPGRVVSVERLIDRLWGDEPPRTPLGTLQSYVSRLRRALETERGAGTSPQVLVSEAPGYVLRVPADQIDVHRFRRLVADARAAAASGRPAATLERLDEAAALWRGPALAGVGPEDQVRAVVVQLDEERDSAVEDRFEALLALGRHQEAVPALQLAVDEKPLRERRWALLAAALYRSSRQADALRALSSARAVLLEDLGLDPGPELRELEQRILAQDPALLAATHEVTAPVTVVAEPVAESGPELVGRRTEWTALSDALDAAARGRAQLVLVEGEPGIGKSTLSEAILAHAQDLGWATAVGRCVEPGLAPSLWPCIEIVRTMVEELGKDGEVNPLRQLVERQAEAGFTLSPVEMAGQFVHLLDQLGDRPRLVLIDDLHWADRATLDVVRLVLERLGRHRILVVCAHRPPELAPDSLLGEALGGLHRSTVATTRIRMSPLDAPDVARLMEITSGVAPSAELADRVRRRAGGNPLFVAELARLAGERGVAEDHVDVPTAIRDVVRSRLAQLPERATAELEVAAVLGERFELRTAMAASERDPDACLDALDAAIVTRILVPDESGFRFAHALVRDAVLADVSSLRLARLHHRAAEAILAVHGDDPDAAEPVAHHRLASASFADPVVVATALVRASSVARWRGALDVADRLAEQALETLAGGPRTQAAHDAEIEALEAIIGVAYRREDPAATAAMTARIDDFAAATGSEAATALTLFIRWGGIDETDDLSTVRFSVDRAEELLTTYTDDYAVLTLRYMAASWLLMAGEVDAAAAHTDLALAVAGGPDPDTTPDHVPMVLLPLIAALVAALQGDPAAAHEHAYRRALAWMRVRSAVDPTASLALAFYRALTAAILDDPQEVHDQLAGISRTDPTGFVRAEALAADLLVEWARVRLGEADGLERAFAAMAGVERSPEHILRSCLRTFVADACLTLDDDRAVGLLETAAAEARSRGERWWLAETMRLQAIGDRQFGDGRRADDLLAEAEALARQQGARLLVERLAAQREVAS